MIAGSSIASMPVASSQPDATTTPVPDPTPTPTPTVTSVVVSPGIATVAGGGFIQFSAQAFGTNTPPQTFTWTSDAGSVDAAGRLAVPAPIHGFQVINVTATSTLNPSAKGVAIITILAIPLTYERTTMAKLDATMFINQMQIGQHSQRALTTIIEALVDDLAQIRSAHAALAAKLDADAGVTDTNYAATTTVPEAAVNLGK